MPTCFNVKSVGASSQLSQFFDCLGARFIRSNRFYSVITMTEMKRTPKGVRGGVPLLPPSPQVRYNVGRGVLTLGSRFMDSENLVPERFRKSTGLMLYFSNSNLDFPSIELLTNDLRKRATASTLNMGNIGAFSLES